MKALLIEVDFSTGERAGGINPRDPGLRGNPQWQDLEGKPGKEIRLIADKREAKAYEGIPGVTILDGKEEINKAIEELFPPKAAVIDMLLIIEAAKEKGFSLENFMGKTHGEIAEIALKNGLAGAIRINTPLME